MNEIWQIPLLNSQLHQALVFACQKRISRLHLLLSVLANIHCTHHKRTHPYVYVRCNGLLMPPLIRQLTDKIDEYYTHFYIVVSK